MKTIAAIAAAFATLLLHREIVRALNSPDVRQGVTSQGAEPVGSTPEQFTAFVQDEIVKWAKVIQAAGIKRE